MATVPLSGTNIRLLSGIPFSNDYKNTRWFDNISQQRDWFSSRSAVHVMSESVFQAEDKATRAGSYVSVNLPIDELYEVNYLMFQNAKYNNKWFYAFVTKVEYANRSTSKVYFEIDVLQTWRFDYTFKPSMVLREHKPLWNADGTPIINTIDEGLNYGDMYDTVSIENIKPHEDIFFLVIVSKQRMDMNGGNQITPMVNGAPQPLSYYVHPFLRNGGQVKATWNGTTFDIPSAQSVLKGLYTIESAVNNIVSIYVTEHIGAFVGTSGNTVTMSNVFSYEMIQDGSNSISTFYIRDLKNYGTTNITVGNKYSGYTSVSESKLLMYPYTLTVIDDFKGSRIEVKNEYIRGNDLRLQVKGSLGVSNKTSYSVLDYNMNSTQSNANYGNMETALINNNANDVPIINDMLSAYLQGNRNSLNNQADSIMFNGITNALGGMIGGVANGLSGAMGGGAVGAGAGIASGIVGTVQGGGNAVLQLQQIEAKQKDINNVPPQIQKMGSNTAFEFGNGFRGVYVIKKEIKSEYRKKLTDFFNMYGYKSNDTKIPNFHTRRYWNFVQTLGCEITARLNTNDARKIKSIFDNGITLWHTDDIGNYALNNEVIS